MDYSKREEPTSNEICFCRRGKDVQVNMNDDWEDRKYNITFLRSQSNLDASLLDKQIAKATVQPL